MQHDADNNPVMDHWPADTVGNRVKNCIGLLLHEEIITMKEARNLFVRWAKKFQVSLGNRIER